jgi:hypothetical protein
MLRRVSVTAFLRSLRRLLVTANVVPNSPILVTLMMETLRSSETSVLTRVTQRNNPGDGILLFFLLLHPFKEEGTGERRKSYK